MRISDLYGPVESAIYDTVNDYVDPQTGRRGSTALAPRVGMQPNTLSNKANPTCDHELKLRESIPLQLASNNFAILIAYASVLGHCAIRLPDATDTGDAALLDTYCQMHAEVGDFAEDMRDALADSTITKADVEKMRIAFDRVVRAGLGVIARMGALAHD